MGIKGNKAYFVAIFFSILLLVPGMALQQAFGHGTTYKIPKGVKDPEYLKGGLGCTLVKVQAEIKKVTIDWYTFVGKVSEFNDYADGNGEVQILYAFWEPKHEKFKGEKRGSIYLDDVKLKTKYTTIGGLPVTLEQAVRTQKEPIGVSALPDKPVYVHITCKEDLTVLGVIFAAAELDGRKSDLTAVKALQIGATEGVEKLATEAAKKGSVKILEKAGKSIAKKIGGLALGGAGLAYTIYDTLSDASDFLSWISGEVGQRVIKNPNQSLGVGVWALNLKLVEKEGGSKTFTVDTNPYKKDQKLVKSVKVVKGEQYGDLTIEYEVSIKSAPCHSYKQYKYGEHRFHFTLKGPFHKYSFSPDIESLDSSSSENIDTLHYATYDSTYSAPQIQYLSTSDLPNVPAWIKNNAKWWSDGLISDEEFVKAIEYLVELKIITAPGIKIMEETTTKYLKLNSNAFELPKARGLTTEVQISGYVENYVRGDDVSIVIERPDGSLQEQTILTSDGKYVTTYFLQHDFSSGQYKIITKYKDTADSITFTVKSLTESPNLKSTEKAPSYVGKEIPYWIKNNAKWWYEGSITDEEFTTGIKYMISENIIITPRIIVQQETDTSPTMPQPTPTQPTPTQPTPTQPTPTQPTPTQPTPTQPTPEQSTLDEPATELPFPIDENYPEDTYIDPLSQVVIVTDKHWTTNYEEDLGIYRTIAFWELEYENGEPFSQGRFQILINNDTNWNKFVEAKNSDKYYDGSNVYGKLIAANEGFLAVAMYTLGTHTLDITDFVPFIEGDQFFSGCNEITVTVPSFGITAIEKSASMDIDPWDQVLKHKVHWRLVQGEAPVSNEIIYVSIISPNHKGEFYTVQAKTQTDENGNVKFFTHPLENPGEYRYVISHFDNPDLVYSGDGDEIKFFIECTPQHGTPQSPHCQ